MSVTTFGWTIENNFPEADFWLINQGSTKSLGKPVKDFEPFLTGILCPALIYPPYGFYICEYFHLHEIWHQYSHGVTDLQSLRISDIRQVFREVAKNHRQQKQFITIRA